ncbi:MAG: sugar ABC transporter permease [Bacilli bacterium]|nr:sugar ABC transporter permease [Bacilli bacterium]
MQSAVMKKPLFKNPRKAKRALFYWCILALPLIQFLIFYVYVNFDSVILAFQSYEQPIGEVGYTVSFAGLSNFKNVFDIIKAKPFLLTNSLLLFVVDFFIGIPLALLFSYYIYKRRFFSSWFRVLLFLPQIISGTVFAIFFKELVSFAFPQVGLPNLLASDPNTTRMTLILFSLCMTFGVNVILFTGAMTSIPPSLIEASELDGCNPIQEFFHVTIPSIFPTLVSFIIIAISGIFVNQMFLFTFHLSTNEFDTIGYFIYSQSQSRYGGLVPTDGQTASYSTLSAFSLMITLILFPLTLTIRKLLTKFGPSPR